MIEAFPNLGEIHNKFRACVYQNPTRPWRANPVLSPTFTLAILGATLSGWANRWVYAGLG